MAITRNATRRRNNRESDIAAAGEKRKREEEISVAIHSAFEKLKSCSRFEDLQNLVTEEFGSEKGRVFMDSKTEQELDKIADIEDLVAPIHNRYEAEKKMKAIIHDEDQFQKEAEKFKEIVESFIETMKLIQVPDDRKFLDWNSSVLDSIMGVFLTQNVNDVKSSSAFMMLRSKYPASNKQTKSGPPVVKKHGEENLSDHHRGLSEKKRNYWKRIRQDCNPPENRPTDSVDWHAVRKAKIDVIAEVIEPRGQQTNIATRMKLFLDDTFERTGDLDLEWPRNANDPIVKNFLNAILGIGVKSAECVSLLELRHRSFPVDANVDHIATRLGWIFLQPLRTEFHHLKGYPAPNEIQKYLWPRLRMLDQKTLFELHYLLITFGKVFCTKKDPNCKACPLKEKCKYYASSSSRRYEPTIDISSSSKSSDGLDDDDVQIPVAQIEQQLIVSLLKECDESQWDLIMKIIYKGSIPPPESVTVVNRKRAIHNAYVLKDDHPFLKQFEKRVADDPCSYLLVIPIPKAGDRRNLQDKDIEGTIMVPSRTAMNQNFPLNGTYFQVNEVFADCETGKCPIQVSREQLEGLERVPLYCGSTASSIYKGMSLLEILFCFWKGYVCSRGFDRKTRASKDIPKRLEGTKKGGNPNTFIDWYEYDHWKV